MGRGGRGGRAGSRGTARTGGLPRRVRTSAVGVDRRAGADDGSLPAGSFSVWLDAMGRALAGAADADVPCGDCTACCSAGQFVTVGPDETDTLAHVPPALLFPAPHRPGYRVIPHDARGRCPMLGEAGCSIYPHRPRACRTYDCRIFVASGIDVATGDPAKAGIARQARRWRFDPPTTGDVVRRDAVGRAACFLAEHPEATSPGGGAERLSATDRAAAAVVVHDLFDDTDRPHVPTPTDVAGRLMPLANLPTVCLPVNQTKG